MIGKGIKVIISPFIHLLNLGREILIKHYNFRNFVDVTYANHLTKLRTKRTLLPFSKRLLVPYLNTQTPLNLVGLASSYNQDILIYQNKMSMFRFLKGV